MPVLFLFFFSERAGNRQSQYLNHRVTSRLYTNLGGTLTAVHETGLVVLSDGVLSRTPPVGYRDIAHQLFEQILFFAAVHLFEYRIERRQRC